MLSAEPIMMDDRMAKKICKRLQVFFYWRSRNRLKKTHTGDTIGGIGNTLNPSPEWHRTLRARSAVREREGIPFMACEDSLRMKLPVTVTVTVTVTVQGLETLYLLTFQGFGLRRVRKTGMLYTSTIVAS